MKIRIIIAVVAVALACAVMVPAAEAKRPAGHDRGHHYGWHKAAKKATGYWYEAPNGALFWIWTVPPKPPKPGDGHVLGRTPWHPGGSVLVPLPATWVSQGGEG